MYTCVCVMYVSCMYVHISPHKLPSCLCTCLCTRCQVMRHTQHSGCIPEWDRVVGMCPSLTALNVNHLGDMQPWNGIGKLYCMCVHLCLCVWACTCMCVHTLWMKCQCIGVCVCEYFTGEWQCMCVCVCLSISYGLVSALHWRGPLARNRWSYQRSTQWHLKCYLGIPLVGTLVCS